MICLFYINLIFCEAFNISSEVKISIFLIICLIQGFCNSMLQTTLSRFIFTQGRNEITGYTTGTAIAGVVCAFVAF